jgi:hypothetical protein
MREVLANEDEMNARVFQFPASAIKQNDRKINYYDFLTKAENLDCNAALKRIYARVDMAKIQEFIDDVPYISDLQRKFYKRYIAARFDLILCPAHETVLSAESEQGMQLM